MRHAALLIVLFSLSSICTAQTTWYVPDDFSTIQGALSDATVLNGDTVIVRPGTYDENLDFLGKGITLKSELGPDVTVIDGNKLGSVVSFVNGEEASSVLDGFTISNGHANLGGGITCLLSSSSIINNIITANTADSGGGGIYCGTSDPQINANIISGNSATSTDFGGGGICCFLSSPLIVNNTIIDNSALFHGGGIFCTWGSEPYLTNSTIVGNTAGSIGGGVYCWYYSYLVISNSILWGNNAQQGPEMGIGTTLDPSGIIIKYSDVEGGQSSVHVVYNCILNWNAGMIDSYPRFVDQANRDFHLKFDSPCRGAGVNTATGLPLGDFEGDPRIAYGTVDMGADEFHPHLYLTGDTTPAGNVNIKMIGLPGGLINGLLIGVNTIDPPLTCDYGLWHMANPFQIMTGFGTIPADGVKLFPGTIPASTPAPMTVYLQAAIDSWLTNLYTVNIQ